MADLNLQKKISKSKKWIDYSSQQENDHSDDEKHINDDHKKHEQKVESKTNGLNTKQKESKQQNIKRSPEPTKKVVQLDRKEQLEKLKQLKYDLLWMQFRVNDQKDFGYLKEKMQQLRKEKDLKIINIYESRDNELTYDVKADVKICQKWLTQDFDTKDIINVGLSRRYVTNDNRRKQFKSPRYQNRDNRDNRDYRDNREKKDYHGQQQGKPTKYLPKYQEKQKSEQKDQFQKKNYTDNRDKPEKYEKYEKYAPKYEQKDKQGIKKKYIEKNPIAQKIQQKVEQELAEKRQQKKEQKKKQSEQGTKAKKQSKNDKPSSKFYSKNPFDALGF